MQGVPFQHDDPIYITSTDAQEREIPHVRRDDCLTNCSALESGIQSSCASLFYLGDETDKETGAPVQQIFLVLAETSQSSVYNRLGLLPVECPRTDPELPRHFPCESFLKDVNELSTAFRQAQSDKTGKKKVNNSNKEEEEDSRPRIVTWDKTDIQTITIV